MQAAQMFERMEESKSFFPPHKGEEKECLKPMDIVKTSFDHLRKVVFHGFHDSFVCFEIFEFLHGITLLCMFLLPVHNN